ncbi:MAG TPA: hypothetical protein VLF89_02140 [Candidatus Saccharimonadales bacterium]|nr:hypothetical protein [Candidatus Saccharimonadales bacterium]
MLFKEGVTSKGCYGIKFLKGEIVAYSPKELGKIGYFDAVGLPVKEADAEITVNPGDRGLVDSFMPSYEITVIFNGKRVFIPEEDLVT